MQTATPCITHTHTHTYIHYNLAERPYVLSESLVQLVCVCVRVPNRMCRVLSGAGFKNKQRTRFCTGHVY